MVVTGKNPQNTTARQQKDLAIRALVLWQAKAVRTEGHSKTACVSGNVSYGIKCGIVLGVARLGASCEHASCTSIWGWRFKSVVKRKGSQGRRRERDRLSAQEILLFGYWVAISCAAEKTRNCSLSSYHQSLRFSINFCHFSEYTVGKRRVISV